MGSERDLVQCWRGADSCFVVFVLRSWNVVAFGAGSEPQLMVEYSVKINTDPFIHPWCLDHYWPQIVWFHISNFSQLKINWGNAWFRTFFYIYNEKISPFFTQHIQFTKLLIVCLRLEMLHKAAEVTDCVVICCLSEIQMWGRDKNWAQLSFELKFHSLAWWNS